MDGAGWWVTVQWGRKSWTLLSNKLLLLLLTTQFLEMSPNKTPVVGRKVVSHKGLHPNPWLSHYIEFADRMKVSNQLIRDYPELSE